MISLSCSLYRNWLALAMANSKGTNIRNLMFAGKNPLLPPKCPFPTVSSTNNDNAPNNVIGSKVVQKPREGSAYHQRTSSESFLIEEQPSWLDDLLNEPETPVHRGGHRRSSSDSFAYIDVSDAPSLDYAAQDDYGYKTMNSGLSWASQDFDHHNRKDFRLNSFYADVNLVKQNNRAWDSSLNAVSHPSGLPSLRGNTFVQGLGSCAAREVEGAPKTGNGKQDSAKSGPLDEKAFSEKKDNSHAKSSASDCDTKRAKQPAIVVVVAFFACACSEQNLTRQFAQRSRVRKLQYIAELERNAEGSKVSAELEFLNQQNLILSMENKALSQRLESLSQEHAIKFLEQEVLERELGRLRGLYQQQQQQQKHPSSNHRRSSSRDIDSQFANLSLKEKDTSSGHDTHWSTPHLNI
ncbi:Basic leucine zipper 6 [Hibiscus syriacus]|uniref:Basic leucine zipper 6 n=1 Tax=Hibiscus syriacus TaxID=106335 RepID=A0A6A3A5Y1_HIBSY|nr:Basic leucine zipper 6 [Hibiscus syriacus]